ncbi:hypothetical protein QNI19_31885 [Cytophagaceae bacterium DM2B3-1]|uniref:Uncharacterized protein n=1 Tax=Xanthocytophaga flava TaxID=3048013 RepID=A0ABT7CUY8_9BACT|nr:hypothetical protein [Xanthocytophaga flavus]MDJ1497583.1 hypothetical protein [Xanthocytophaga flavus]
MKSANQILKDVLKNTFNQVPSSVMPLQLGALDSEPLEEVPVIAIKIDVYTKSIYPVLLQKIGTNCLDSECSIIGCEQIHIIRNVTPKKEEMVLDAEGHLKNDLPPSFDFIKTNMSKPWTVIGNALIISVDENGETENSHSTIEEIRTRVRFHEGFFDQLQSVLTY